MNKITNENDKGQKNPWNFSKNNILAIFVGFFIMILFFVIWLVYIINDDGKIFQDGISKEGKRVGTEESRMQNTLFSLNLVEPVFADYAETYKEIPRVVPNNQIIVDELENLGAFKDNEGITLNDEQRKTLEEVGFFLTKNNIITNKVDVIDDFVDTYSEFAGKTSKYYREPQDTVFITSDLALHLYHILVDRSFQKIEETKFQPMLWEITEALFEDALKNYKAAADEKIKDSYKRLAVFYLVPLVVLDASKTEEEELRAEDFSTFAQFMKAEEERAEKIASQEMVFSLDSKIYKGVDLGEEIYDLAQAEISLISKAEKILPSPLFTPLRQEFLNDYSQFKPRSHYTKNNILKSYFIAMMWYGRMGFTLNSLELTRDALIITGQINSLEVGGKKISEIWSSLSSAVQFFVGEDDDLNAFHYTKVAQQIFGEGISEGELLDDELLRMFSNTAIENLPQPRIVSEALAVYDDLERRKEMLASIMQFRFFGQKFTLDAYLLNNLTQGVGAPDKETGQNLPSMPTALMPISLLESNNKVVKNYLNQWINKNASESDKVIEKYYKKLNNEILSYNNSVWTQNIYWSWLDCFRTLLGSYGEGYPPFMIGNGWQKKNLETVLGSYAELKHDTLLYAKQSYAELGGGGDNPEEVPLVPKGYVEPDLEFWNKIIVLANKTQIGLEEREIMPEVFKNRYQTFIKFAEFCKYIVEQELQNKIISDDDFERLRLLNIEFSSIVRELPGEVLPIKDRRAGIIADIHTDAVNELVLYEATAKPYIIWVAISDINGERLTRGAVYNHYELIGGVDERMADEDWQKIVYEGDGELPEINPWEAELLK